MVRNNHRTVVTRVVVYVVFAALCLGIPTALVGFWSGLSFAAAPLSFGTYLLVRRWRDADRAVSGGVR